jgi:hypothetical protein
LHFLDKGGGAERAVIGVRAVQRHVIRRGRIGIHHTLRLVDVRKAPRRGKASRLAAIRHSVQAIGNRVVSTCVKNHYLDAARGVERRAHIVDRDEIVANADLVFQLSVDLHQVVLALI